MVLGFYEGSYFRWNFVFFFFCHFSKKGHISPEFCQKIHFALFCYLSLIEREFLLEIARGSPSIGIGEKYGSTSLGIFGFRISVQL